MFLNIELEAKVVGIVCIFFLCMMVYSGIRQIRKDHEDL